MRNSITIAILFLSVVTVTSCSNSKKDGAATINDLKAKIEKEKKEKATNDAELKKLEADLLRMDSNTAMAAKVKLVSTMSVTTQAFEHFIDLLGRVDADNVSYISPRGMGGQVKAIYIKEGQFVSEKPAHPYFLEGVEAQTASNFMTLQFYNNLETIELNGAHRKKILELFQLSLSWHYKKFNEIKSLPILQAVLH